MFLTQIYGTVLGGFINYAVMISIVAGNKELLADSNGDSSWSGATIQSYNTNASTWALAAYLYKQGQTYSIVPYGLIIGAGIVVVHRITVQVRFPFSLLGYAIFLLANCVSSFLRLVNSPFTKSTFRSLFSSQGIFRTTSHRPACCSAGRLLGFTHSSTFVTTDRAFSRTTLTWLLVHLMARV
jgi:hypothetical protein